MNISDPPTGEWVTGHQAWDAFVSQHPELGLNAGRWGFHNCMRRHRQALLDADALRIANGKHYIAHRERFPRLLFELVTTPPPWLQSVDEEARP